MRSQAEGHSSAVRDRVLLVLGIAIFVILFQWIYRTCIHIHPLWSHLGFDYRPLSLPVIALSFVLSTAPGLWMPLALEGPSDFMYWSIYLTVFIPSMFVPFCVGLRPEPELWQLAGALFAGFAILRCYRVLPVLSKRQPHLSPRAFWIVFWVGSGLLLAAVLRLYWGHFRLVALADVYEELRGSGGQRLEGTFVGYAVGLLANVSDPFLMAVGLFRRRWGLFAVGAAGQVLLYSTAGMRSVVLSVIVIPVVYWAARRGSRFGLRLIGVAAAGCWVLRIMVGMFSGQLSGAVDYAASIVLMRSLAIPGLLTAQYQGFFAEHPKTHLSHVHGVNLFVPYPYGGPIGVEVNRWVTGNAEGNANASFLATDGIGGFGLPGLLLIGALGAVVFWLLDNSPPRGGGPFAAVLCSSAAMSLCNTSLFTTLLSGGLGCIMLLLWLAPRELVAPAHRE